MGLFDKIIDLIGTRKPEDDDSPLYIFDFVDTFSLDLSDVISEAESTMRRRNELLMYEVPTKVVLSNTRQEKNNKVYTFEVWKT